MAHWGFFLGVKTSKLNENKEWKEVAMFAQTFFFHIAASNMKF